MWLLGFELRTSGRAVSALTTEPSLHPLRKTILFQGFAVLSLVWSEGEWLLPREQQKLKKEGG